MGGTEKNYVDRGPGGVAFQNRFWPFGPHQKVSDFSEIYMFNALTLTRFNGNFGELFVFVIQDYAAKYYVKTSMREFLDITYICNSHSNMFVR